MATLTPRLEMVTPQLVTPRLETETLPLVPLVARAVNAVVTTTTSARSVAGSVDSWPTSASRGRSENK